MLFAFLKSKKFLIILISVIVVLTPSSYAAASYFQSNELVAEGDKLVKAGDYSGAILKYDQAQDKWKWNHKKIIPKITTAQNYHTSNRYLTQMSANFGKGEWQKCLDELKKIDKDFPRYSQAQKKYNDCQKKLDDQVAAAKAAAEVKAAADAETARVAAAKAAAAAAARATNINAALAKIVVFEDNRDNVQRGIYSINNDGSNLKLLVAHITGTNDTNPILSPDGRKVVFQRKGTASDLYIVDSDGKNLIKFFTIEPDWNLVSYIWTTDSKKIVYERYYKYVKGEYSNRQELYCYDIATRVNTKISAGDVNAALDFIISDDNQKVAYKSALFTPLTLEARIININGTGEEKFVIPTEFDDFYGFTGNKLYYKTRSGISARYMAYDLTTKTNTEVQYNALVDKLARVKSPDGKYLAYRSGNSYNLYICNNDGGGEKKLSSLSTGYYFSWSPDSKLIIFYSSNSIYSVSIGGVQKKIITIISPVADGA